ncbi:MAG: DUF5058 family protein [Lachnospiraceae bacterium]|nr:DUF5058 family protein [Lachnospiraceae bacterium]
MGTFLEVANSGLVYIVAMAGILLVIGVLIAFLIVALRQAKAIGMDNKKIWTTVRATILVSLGPSLSILVPFLAMMMLLGVPWSWYRLSVVGSAGQEMALATMVMNIGGFGSLGTETAGEAFCFYTVGIGIIYCTGMLANILLNKAYSSGIQKSSRGKHSGLISAITGSLFIGMMGYLASYLMVPYVQSATWVAILTFITGLVISLAVDIINGKYKIKWLRDYSFAICLILNMCSAIVWNVILN